jgi:hypothetical protein
MADLKPGSCELVCFLPGHFAAGQKLPFTVKQGVCGRTRLRETYGAGVLRGHPHCVAP